MPKKLTAIDLFCGCGGLSLGLRRAHFRVIAALDNNALSVATYRKNHARTLVVEQDIGVVDAHALMTDLDLKPGRLDLLAGCPPCQGFSTLRTLNGGRVVEEPLNDLVFEFVRFVRVFRPRAVMLENVPALLNDDRLRQVERELADLGYLCTAQVLNAENFGVPQRRLRMIMMGSRRGCPSFATPQRRRRTVAQAIRRLPSPNNSDDPVHSYPVRRTPRVLALMQRIPKDGGSRTDLPAEHQLDCHKRSTGFKDVYGRMAWSQPAPTITGGCINPSKGRFTHPEEDRSITLREAALLQGFPRSYYFDVSQGRYPTAQLIGNAFPPKFAEHHARAIHSYLQTDYPLTQ